MTINYQAAGMAETHGLMRAAAGLALAGGMLALAACAPDEHPTPWAGPDAVGTGSCTGLGEYSVAPSAVGPNPVLPKSSLGIGFTPRIGLNGTKADADAPTVGLTVWAEEPEPSVHESVEDMILGDELTFRGYTLKVTSICAGSARLDLVSQAE